MLPANLKNTLKVPSNVFNWLKLTWILSHYSYFYISCHTATTKIVGNIVNKTALNYFINMANIKCTIFKYTMDFPTMPEKDLKILFTCLYQYKQCISYLSEILNENGTPHGKCIKEYYNIIT